MDLSDPRAAFANDRANKDVGNQETKGVCLGRGGGCLAKRFVVQCSDDQTKGLCNGERNKEESVSAAALRQETHDMLRDWGQGEGRERELFICTHLGNCINDATDG